MEFNVKNTKRELDYKTLSTEQMRCSGVVTIEINKDEGTIITITLPIV
jgi:hypothetical protein